MIASQTQWLSLTALGLLVTINSNSCAVALAEDGTKKPAGPKAKPGSAGVMDGKVSLSLLDRLESSHLPLPCYRVC